MGAPRREKCIHGHDLTDEANIVIVKRGKYDERQCKPCKQKRARDWWKENRGKRASS